MNERLEFLKELRRMCDTYKNCISCPIQKAKKNTPCQKYLLDNPEKSIEILDKWIKDHPKRTYLIDFLEKYPNAVLDEKGLPESICPYFLGLKVPYNEHCSGYNCAECWNTVMEVKNDRKQNRG